MVAPSRKYGKDWLGELSGDEESNSGYIECEVSVELASSAVYLTIECTCLHTRSGLKI